MHNKHPYLLTLLMAGLLSIVLSARVWASIPQELAMKAQQDLLLGRMDDALDKLARAYILEPENKTLLQDLLRLNNDKLLSLDNRLILGEVHDRILQMNRSQRELENYALQIPKLVSALTEQGLDIELITLEMALLEGQSQKRQEGLVQQAQARYTEAQEPLDFIAASLRHEHDEMSERLALARSQMARLKQFSRGGVSDQSQRMNSAEVEAMKIKHMIFHAYVNAPSEREPVSIASNTSGQVAELALKLRETEMRLDEQNTQIRILMSSLDELKGDYSGYEDLVNEKNEEIARQNMEIADLKSQLMLRQRIVQEKEEGLEEISSAQAATLADYQRSNEELKRQLSEQNRSMRQLEAMLAIYQEKSQRDTLQPSSAQRISHAAPTDKEEGRFLAQQIGELKSIIDMYKGLLSEAKGASQRSSRQITQFEDENQRLQELLAKQNKTLMDAEFKLLSMKKELSNVQARFYAFKSLPATKDYAKMEEDLRFIEDDLKNIHTFLLNQLDDFEKLNKDFIAGDLNDMDRVLTLDLDRIQSN